MMGHGWTVAALVLFPMFLAGCAETVPPPPADEGPVLDEGTYDVVMYVESASPHRVNGTVLFAIEVHGDVNATAQTMEALLAPPGTDGRGTSCRAYPGVALPSPAHYHANCRLSEPGMHNATARIEVAQDGQTFEWFSPPVAFEVLPAADP